MVARLVARDGRPAAAGDTNAADERKLVSDSSAGSAAAVVPVALPVTLPANDGTLPNVKVPTREGGVGSGSGVDGREPLHALPPMLNPGPPVAARCSRAADAAACGLRGLARVMADRESGTAATGAVASLTDARSAAASRNEVEECSDDGGRPVIAVPARDAIDGVQGSAADNGGRTVPPSTLPPRVLAPAPTSPDTDALDDGGTCSRSRKPPTSPLSAIMPPPPPRAEGLRRMTGAEGWCHGGNTNGWSAAAGGGGGMAGGTAGCEKVGAAYDGMWLTCAGTGGGRGAAAT